MKYTVALFGESQKGQFRKPYCFQNLTQLADNLGEPPPESQGLQFAIQTLLYKRGLVFFRVHEEGFSIQDYLLGLKLLESKESLPVISAICLPGVGNNEIIEATSSFCLTKNSFLITTEKDLYDYLTSSLTNPDESRNE